MRLNKFLSSHTDLSRRGADSAIQNGRVTLNGQTAELGVKLTDDDVVALDGQNIVATTQKPVTLLLNKPVGYVCSKDGQGSPTVYDLIPEKHHNLNIAGRLDKDSSGLVVMTSDGDLLNELTHPSNNKEKVYEVTVDRELTESELSKLIKGVDIGDERPSKFKSIKKLQRHHSSTSNPQSSTYEVVLTEGRNRQIRRSFESLGASVIKLARNSIDHYNLNSLKDNILFIRYLQ